jgi:hypothetical protein
VDFFAADFFAVDFLALGFFAADFAAVLAVFRAAFLAGDFAALAARFAWTLDRDALALRKWRGRLLHGLEGLTDRARFDEHDVRPQDVVRRAVDKWHNVHVRKVPAAEEDVLLHAVREDQDLLVADAEARRERDQRGRARRVVVEPVDDDDRAFARAGVQRALLRECADLARHVLVVGARRRAEHRAAADRSAARASSPDGRGPFPSASRASGFRRRRTCGSSSTRCPWRWFARKRRHRLVHHGDVDHAVERRLGERHLVGARRAERRVRRRLWCAIRVSHGLPLLANDDDPVRRAGDGAADVDQIALRVHLLDPQADLGVPLRRRSDQASSCP